ncbi:beta-ketoacyl synthase N-terminal-like domain-containing protein [Sporosarcina limicola]|uniref:3-oxoacyl-[acyl-carrier-protein] synthase II n=1 Tax=Sporosarcina limicola TaxID=34101 RepID=A0A927MI83_9BACL|nr:beta-ketoacyl synthase N-terminal-like domain-containing protein [Sporosarcina limicola]MBE1555098.1 3-oxoacyl-[acyl-carrier-protein] synthase II [Sporosarcina limicola]
MGEIAITGIGCITPWGDEISSLSKALIMKTQNNSINQVEDFDVKRYIMKKGLRSLQKSTQMALASTQLALKDAQHDLKDNEHDRLGVFVGNSMSYLNNISDFLDDVYEVGAELVSPIKFPNTVLNNISGWVSIVFDAKGVNNTVNSGNTSSLDALLLAKNYIENGIIDKAIVVGVEEINLGVLHNEFNGGLPDRKMTEASITLILEKSDLQNNKVYGYLDDIFSWQEHTFNEKDYAYNLEKILSKITSTTIREVYFGSSNSCDKVTENEVKKMYGDDTDQYNISSHIGISYAVSGFIKVVLSLLNDGKKIIIETNETGNKSVLSIESKRTGKI